MWLGNLVQSIDFKLLICYYVAVHKRWDRVRGSEWLGGARGISFQLGLARESLWREYTPKRGRTSEAAEACSHSNGTHSFSICNKQFTKLPLTVGIASRHLNFSHIITRIVTRGFWKHDQKIFQKSEILKQVIYFSVKLGLDRFLRFLLCFFGVGGVVEASSVEDKIQIAPYHTMYTIQGTCLEVWIFIILMACAPLKTSAEAKKKKKDFKIIKTFSKFVKHVFWQLCWHAAFCLPLSKDLSTEAVLLCKQIF